MRVLRADVGALLFGGVGPGGGGTRAAELISARGPIQIVEARTDNPSLLLTALELEAGADGSTRRFDLALDPALPEGNINGTVFIKTDLADQAELAIPVAAYVATAAEAPPAPVPAP